MTSDPHKEQPRGQIIVILAFGMVGFLVVAGLATDGGFLLMRQAQLERAVDTATLAGVAEMAMNPTGLSGCALCDERAHEFLAVNGVILDSGNPNHGFQSDEGLADLPGGYRYHIRVTWDSPVFFLTLLGFEDVPLQADATAEYYPMMDLYADATVPSGIMRDTNLAVMGPGGCPSLGDPISPTSGPLHNQVNPAGTYTFRIIIPEDYEYDAVRVELFDPDTYNQPNPAADANNVGHPGAGPEHGSCPSAMDDRFEPCLIETGDDDEATGYYNPYWFWRVDALYTSSCTQPGSYNASLLTETQYRLFYLRQRSSGNLEEIDLAYYTSQSNGGEATDTDLRWVSPTTDSNERMPAITWGPYNFTAEPAVSPDSCGSCSGDGDFIVNLGTEASNVYRDPDTGVRHLYLQVRTLNGSTENGFNIWAGPPRSVSGNVPSMANSRNIWVIGGGGTHDSEGVVVAGLGYLPIRSNDADETDFPLTYMGRGFAGEIVHVQLFDLDDESRTSAYGNNVDPEPLIYFHFNTISRVSYAMCYDEHNECNIGGGITLNPGTDSYIPNNNTWVHYELPIPVQTGEANIPFFGGYLQAYYEAGGPIETFTWRMTTFSRPFLIH